MTRAAMASTMGTARGTTHGSCRPRAVRVSPTPARVTVSWGRAMVEVGLKAMRRMMGSPFARPPWMPPLRLVRVRTSPSGDMKKASLCSEPKARAPSKPEPISTP